MRLHSGVKIRCAFLRYTGTGGLDRTVLANTDCHPLCIPRRSLGQSPLAGKCAEFSARRTAFIAGGLNPPQNERAKREVIPATLCTRNTHQALLKPAHPYKHTNHMTSYNPARKLASLLTKNDANLHAGYSRIRVMRAGIGSIKRGHGRDALAQRGENPLCIPCHPHSSHARVTMQVGLITPQPSA